MTHFFSHLLLLALAEREFPKLHSCHAKVGNKESHGLFWQPHFLGLATTSMTLQSPQAIVKVGWGGIIYFTGARSWKSLGSSRYARAKVFERRFNCRGSFLPYQNPFSLKVDCDVKGEECQCLSLFLFWNACSLVTRRRESSPTLPMHIPQWDEKSLANCSCILFCQRRCKKEPLKCSSYKRGESDLSFICISIWGDSKACSVLAP